jgi:hypothetical protein
MKPPILNLTEDKSSSVSAWRKKFDAHCLLEGWRDPTKEPNANDHWKPADSAKEIAAFYLAMPDDILQMFETTIFSKMSGEERKKPKAYLDKLAQHYTGQDNVMPQRLAFFNCTQAATESVSEYEMRIRNIAKKTRFEEMANPLDELMRDRLCTGVHNTDLRELLLHHFKEDGQSPLTFDEQLTRAKAWEAAHNTNISIIQATTKTDEQVNYTARNQRRKCGWCGGRQHPRRDCPAAKPGVKCDNCGMTSNHFTAECRSRNKPQGKTYSHPQRRQKNFQSPPKQVNAVNTSPESPAQGATGGYASEDDDYLIHSFSAFTIDSGPSDKYFTWLPITVTPEKSVKVQCKWTRPQPATLCPQTCMEN